MELPNFINQDFLKNVLEKYFSKDIDSLQFSANNLISSGGNYSSEIKRISITYSLKNEKKCQVLHAIVKYLPEDEYLCKFTKFMKCFESEVYVYNHIFSAISKLDYREKISPQVYYASTEPQPIVVLEDLSSLNYRVLTSPEGLDLHHSLLVVEKLAYMHAASVALHEKDLTILPKQDNICFKKELSTLIDASYIEVIEMCKNRKELMQYADKIKVSKDSIYHKLYNITKTNFKIKVLNHGDCCFNNIMFYYNTNGSLADLAFVDYQVSYFASPCLDLHFFLVTTLKLDTKVQYVAILDYYFKNFTRCLERLHTNTIPVRKEFDEEFRSTAYYGFITSVAVLPLRRAAQIDGVSMKNYFEDKGENSFRHCCFNSKAYYDEMVYYLPFFDDLGVFDN